MVPIRDINCGWILAVNIFLHFPRGNRVNSIVIYYLFCLSDACRDRERGVGIATLAY